ncbi:DUF3810 domain-containing protein [uncultured Draconibacterium sp.]|uniref:DUF3810 domain-containing protein n=1 Tax=uncultured Draconibacterium sp. TaxID=1573823 RepID=UPI0032605A3F
MKYKLKTIFAAMAGKTNRYRWLILPGIALGFFLLTQILRHQPIFIEKYYSNGIYPVLALVLSQFSSLFPFSLADLLYLFLFLFPVVLLVLALLKKQKWKQAGKALVKLFSISYILFYLLWGFNYFRAPLQQRLGVIDRAPNSEEFVAFIHNYIIELNNLHCSFENFGKEESDKMIEESYQNLATVFNFKYPMGKRPDKKISFSRFYAKSGITGYFGPFFNEVHVNKLVLPVEYPYVLAHEKAHQLGVTSEAEANFYAWLVCTQSSSSQLQYSGKLFILFHLLRQAYGLETYEQLIETISPEVRADIKAIREHHAALRNERLDKAASKLNDAYLKSNNIKSGIKDYTGVVDHVMNFSLDSAFQQRCGLAPK